MLLLQALIIGILMVFSIVCGIIAGGVLYLCYRGDLKNEDLPWKKRILDRLDWMHNGLAVMATVLEDRPALYRMIELSVAALPQRGMSHRFTDTGEEVHLIEGMIVVSHLFEGLDSTQGKALIVSTPFKHLDWMGEEDAKQ